MGRLCVPCDFLRWEISSAPPSLSSPAAVPYCAKYNVWLDEEFADSFRCDACMEEGKPGRKVKKPKAAKAKGAKDKAARVQERKYWAPTGTVDTSKVKFINTPVQFYEHFIDTKSKALVPSAPAPKAEPEPEEFPMTTPRLALDLDD